MFLALLVLISAKIYTISTLQIFVSVNKIDIILHHYHYHCKYKLPDGIVYVRNYR